MSGWVGVLATCELKPSCIVVSCDHEFYKGIENMEFCTSAAVTSETVQMTHLVIIQEGLAVASIARDDPSTLPGDDPFSRSRMHRDRNAR